MSASGELLGDYSDSDFVVLRTPLLPFDELVGWSRGDIDDAPSDTRSLSAERQLLRSHLRELLQRPHVREAIFLASPSLDGHVEDWLNDPESPRGADYERALVRYAFRMAGRPTPFGLFAGVSTGRIGDVTYLSLEGRDGYRRHTRIDAEYLLQVVQGLLGEPERRERTSFRPNPSLYRAGGRRRYVRSLPGAKEHRHVLVSVRESVRLEAALEAAADGATPAAIAAAIAPAAADSTEVRRFVDALIEQQVLLPDLGVQLTGADAVYGLAEASPALGDARAALAALDQAALGISTERYRDIAALLESLPAPLALDRLFQVDITKASPEATVGRDLVREILRSADLLRRLLPPPADGTSKRFIERFRERYEGQAVPLLEALDPDSGVAFGGDEPAPAPLLDGLDRRPGSPSTPRWGEREEHLLSRVTDVLLAGGTELVLDARDIERLEQKDPRPLPDAFAVMAVVAAASDADLAAGRFRVLTSGPDGPSGARLLGRFCHADEALRAGVEAHLRAEEALDLDAIYAEIVHLPRARDVNVLARPVLREYEIDCLGRSGAPSDRQIPLADLLLSLEGDQFVLRSQRLGRRVIPRLTSAHNFHGRGVAAYRFLCWLQGGDDEGHGFWGPLASAPFLPRVRAGRTILSRARWRLRVEDLAPSGSRDADAVAVETWRRERHVPRFVALVEPPYELPVDLDNLLAVDALVQAVRAGRGVRVDEFFPDPTELPVRGPEGSFAHEVVVPFVRTRPREKPRPGFLPAERVERTFPPGSDWVYLRIYTGEAVADRLLTDAIAPLVRQLTGAASIDKWFFLRYRDPEFHLRVRFHGSVQAEAEALGAELLRDGRAWRIELGTYEREVERYGGPEAIELVERVFSADSDAVLELLARLEPGDEGQEERWQVGLAGTDRMLADLGLGSAERFEVVSQLRASRAQELGWGHAERVRIGRRFRVERQLLRRLLAPAASEPTSLAPGLEVLDARSRVVRPLGSKLQRLARAGRLGEPLTEVASSLLHMHLNRLLRGDNVAQEAVICDLLARLYEETAKRKPTP